MRYTTLSIWILLPHYRYGRVTLGLIAAACSEPPTGKVPECTSCIIEYADSVVLAAPAGFEAGANSRIRRDQLGQIYAAPLYDASRIGVFSSNGRFVRAFGRRGRGPAEFEEIKDLQLARGDTLYVLHDDRISVFSPGAFEQVRTTSSRAARMAYNLAVLSDGDIVTARSSTTSGAPAEDLVWLHRSAAAFPVGAGLATTDTASAALFVRNDTIWLVRHDYKLFRKAPSGEWTLVTERPLWYAQDRQSAPHEDRNRPLVNDLLVDAEGRVWVLSYIFAKPPKRPHQGSEQGERMLATSEWQAFTQPRLDIWNPDGTLFVSAQLADGVAGFADTNHVLHVAEDGTGNDIVSVRRLRVTR